MLHLKQTELSKIELFISAISYTQQQAILGFFAFQTPAVFLSGFFSTVKDMPAIFRFIEYVLN